MIITSRAKTVAELVGDLSCLEAGDRIKLRNQKWLVEFDGHLYFVAGIGIRNKQHVAEVMLEAAKEHA